MSDTAAARRRYVEDIRAREQISSPRLLRALAAVPRERFLHKGPWRIKGEAGGDYRSTESADPIHLYHDVLVAIDEKRRLDTGLPSLWAHFLDILDIKEKERVVQIGCGLGYYSAILSEMVGPHGTILAIDCEKAFVERARSSLREYGNVEVIPGDGCRDVGGQADVIIVHAGFTHPHPLWIGSLRRGGRLLVPITRRRRRGTVMKITRTGNGYHAEEIRGLEIFPCRGRGNTGLDERVTDWWEKASALAPLRFHSIAKGCLPRNRSAAKSKVDAARRLMLFRTLDLMTMGSVVANPNRGGFAGDCTSRRADQRDERAAGERAEAETVRFRGGYCRRANSC